MKKILMLIALPLHNFDIQTNKKTAGNQTLYNTLKGYSEQGFCVKVLSLIPVPQENRRPFPNIEIRSLWGGILLHKYRNRKRKRNNKNIDVKINSGNTKFTNNKLSLIKSNLLFYLYFLIGFCGCFFHFIIFRPQVLYGYEYLCTLPMYWFSKIFCIPFVTRYQGTKLSFFINNDQIFFKEKLQIKGTKLPADLIIMANDGTNGQLVLKKLDMDLTNMRFWPNGLNEKNAYINYKKNINYKLDMGIVQDQFIICTANRFEAWKRIDKIIEVFAYLQQKGAKVTFIIIGDGVEKVKLVSMIERMNLKNVIFTGVMEHNETIYHIANSDLYTTMNFGGNLGNSIWEAMSLGTPVCTIENESSKGLLIDGNNAVLVQEGYTNQEIADKILTYINDPERLKQIGLNARDYAKINIHSWPERMEMEAKAVEALMKKEVNCELNEK